MGIACSIYDKVNLGVRMTKKQAVIKSSLLLTTNAEGRLKGWNDEAVRFDGVECAIVCPPRERSNTQELTQFGSLDGSNSSNEDFDPSYSPEPMADIIRKRRSTSLTFLKGLIGF